MRDIKTDFLIIGSGVAGLRAAIELASHGNVIVVTKDIPTECSTEYAQGGVAVALSDEDEVGIHSEDTIKAGDGLCRENAVKVLVEEGPERILELIEWGAEFDREGPRLSFTIEAAHSRRRILHAQGDSTGKELERVLIKKVRALANIQKLPFCTAVDLIVEDGVCKGAYVLKDTSKVSVHAKATILASGGAGQMFSRTTNPAVATGDGMAIAYRAGAVLEDMEFVQFHPTVLFAPAAPQFLLSEAMRGEGAILRNILSEPFMKNYHPAAELAPRDVVSRAIISEMVKTRSSNVYLDLTRLDAEFIKKRFPRIYATCLRYDINITRDRIPVSPAAHYMMGGVKTDLDGMTNIAGLFAAGEVACTGVHGSNRLASNSLLEGLVYGYRAGAAAAQQGAEAPHSTEARKNGNSEGGSPAGPASGPVSAPADLEEIRTSLRRIMWDKVGIIRCAVSLEHASNKLREWTSLMGMDFDTRRGHELKNMLTVASIVTEAALERKGSAGAHYRSDFPGKCEDWQRHIAMVKQV
ncbi:MAG: L-aspartate oxidase [Deltaproteobacteria bacterium]|nr:L-aspartate oxidase [Deltaproteobacteria bacterium]